MKTRPGCPWPLARYMVPPRMQQGHATPSPKLLGQVQRFKHANERTHTHDAFSQLNHGQAHVQWRHKKRVGGMQLWETTFVGSLKVNWQTCACHADAWHTFRGGLLQSVHADLKLVSQEQVYRYLEKRTCATRGHCTNRDNMLWLHSARWGIADVQGGLGNLAHTKRRVMFTLHRQAADGTCTECNW